MLTRLSMLLSSDNAEQELKMIVVTNASFIALQAKEAFIGISFITAVSTSNVKEHLKITE